MRRAALIFVMVGLIGCSGGLDKHGNGIKDGRAFYNNKDYGPYGENAFRAALSDYVQQDRRGTSSDAVERARVSGLCFCWVKKTSFPDLTRDYPWWADWIPGDLGDKERAERTNGAIADRVPPASARCRPITGAHVDAEEVTLIDVTMSIADRTMCPTGYPNPIVAQPSPAQAAEPTVQPQPASPTASIVGRWQAGQAIQGSAEILEFRADGTMRSTIPGIRGAADPKIRDKEYAGKYSFDGQTLVYTYTSCTNVNRSTDSRAVLDTSDCTITLPQSPRNVTRRTVLSLTDRQLVVQSLLSPPSVVYNRVQ